MSPSGPSRVAILGAARTPIGKFGRALRLTPAVKLGAVATRSALSRARVDPVDVPEGLFGLCISAGCGQNPARQVMRAIGALDTAGATTVNMVCGSAMKAVQFADAEIRSGGFGLVLAGGMESMDSAPYLLSAKARWGLRLGPEMLDDAMQRDALLDAYGSHELMGLTGERIARKLHLTRRELDEFAVRSHTRAARASRDGTFAAEIAPVPPAETASGEGLAVDEGPRGDSTIEGLGRLPTTFGTDGLLTAGNSSQLSDGAAALLLASEAEAEQRGAKPLAWIHSGCVSGVAPDDVMESPIPTVKRHLERTGFRPEDFARVEHNEAFSSASVAVQRAFGFTDEQFNVHGGAVALGHPIGASGARIVVTLLHELIRSKGKLGLATLCMGGGNGLSLILDRRDL